MVEGSELGIENEMSIDALNLSANVYVTFKSIVAYSVPSEADSTETYAVSDVSVDPDTLGAGYENKVREHGSTTFTIKPADKLAIDSVSDLSENKEEGTNVVSTKIEKDGSCVVTISNITADVSLSVKTINLYKVTIAANKKGKMTVKDADGNAVKSGDMVKEGSKLTVETVPALGYGISSLNAPLKGKAAKTEFEVTGDTNLRANYRKLVMVAKAKASKKKATISWTKVEGAERYVIYLTPCTKDKFSKYKTVKASKTKLKVRIRKVKAPYKFKVVAQKKVNGKYKTICSCSGGHFVSTKNKKYTNPKTITTTASLTVEKGKTAKIKAKIVKVKAGKKLLSAGHAPKYRYVTADDYIAKVSKKGVITGKHPGTCKIYIQAANGLWKAVKVTVK